MNSKKILKNMSKNNLHKTNSSKNKLLVPGLVFILLVIGIGWGMAYFKDSLFKVMPVPNFELKDQNNQTVSDDTMRGKVYLVEFFYSTCPTICPIMNKNMKHIQDEINNPDFGIVSISIDPTHDTPEVLKAHAKVVGATSPNWHFLTGDRTYIGDLADQFSIYVGAEEDKAESLNHSGMIALVDKDGNVRCRYNENNMPILYYSGLNFSDPEGTQMKLTGKYHPDREKLIEDIQKLLK